ncbi:ferritin [Arachidicoccus rhizosphaerae]|jgi:ferritin|uniref:Ferritin n=1 Tax=Arachidicoccus rhizosphaerae TaxID=551991 RepID=A0A1H3XKK2_9BACT|nr:ferritin [Arachidicoccus rhizosphaerae]SDZ99068.1 ferritin [Arachidicoccus rhizosphaerae]
MNTDRLSPAMNLALNHQLTTEAEAAQSYLALASWADDKGYSGISNFLFRHAHEERNHMMKFLRYILDRGSKVKIAALSEPGPDPKSIQDCFNKVFEQEVSNTESINKIVKQSFEEQDWATWNFLQWFVKEQVEEETLALNLLDKIKIAGGEKAADEALLELNKELGHMPDEAHSASSATESHPS